jgi:hypothetical protein
LSEIGPDVDDGYPCGTSCSGELGDALHVACWVCFDSVEDSLLEVEEDQGWFAHGGCARIRGFCCAKSEGLEIEYLEIEIGIAVLLDGLTIATVLQGIYISDGEFSSGV